MDTYVERTAGEDKDVVSLRIMATTDLHMHILPYDYLSDAPVDRWGLSNTARLIYAARAEVENSILLDNGDFLHGTAMGDLVSEASQQTGHALTLDIHPMIAAMTHLRYDGATLGNHDFDRGASLLLSAIEQADFPIVSANTVDKLASDPEKDATFVPPYVILNRKVKDTAGKMHDLRIGVIGFLPPGMLKSDTKAPMPVTRDIVEAAYAHVPAMRRKGAQVVIALAHSGIGNFEHEHNMENALIPLSRVPGIDAIIGGHSHQVFPHPEAFGMPDPAMSNCANDCGEADMLKGTLNGLPTVLPGFWGSHLGVIDLNLERHNDTDWKLVQHSSSLRSVAADACSEPADHGQVSAPALHRLLEHLHESTLAHLRTPVGYLTGDLSNYFAMIGHDTATQFVQAALMDEAQRFARGTELENLPIVASSAPFKSGGLGGPSYYTTVQAGELTLRAISDLYLYPNELELLKVKGSYLRCWLERAASVFNQVLPGERGAHLKERETPGYLFETLAGLSYEIDLSQPARYTPMGDPTGLTAGRIRNLCQKGQPIDDDQEFLMATNDFRVGGGGGYPALPERAKQWSCATPIRDIVLDYVKRNPVLGPSRKPIWSFSPVEGASVLMRSSPKALGAIPETYAGALEQYHAEDKQGFAIFELAL